MQESCAHEQLDIIPDSEEAYWELQSFLAMSAVMAWLHVPADVQVEIICTGLVEQLFCDRKEQAVL